MQTVFVMRSNQMGDGDPELGARILGTLLRKSAAVGDLTAIVFYNSGVKLLAKGSPVLSELHLLQEAGVDLLPCGTCVAHYGLELALGSVSDMDTIVRELSTAKKVITL